MGLNFLNGLMLAVSQTEPWETRHEVWISDKPIAGDRSQAKLAHVVHGVTRDHQQLKVEFSQETIARYVQIRTTISQGYPAWNEIEIDIAGVKRSSAK